MKLLERAVHAIKRQLDASAGQKGTYGRGIDATEDISAVPRLPGIASQEIDAGVMLTAEELDWMFTADELVIDGARIEPEKGDWWKVERSDGKFLFYEVLSDQSGRCYAPSDHYGALIRVHMKLNRIEDPPL